MATKKILLFLGWLGAFWLYTNLAWGQGTSFANQDFQVQLIEADRLYEQSRFSAALVLYQQAFPNHPQFSNRQLLRMADLELARGASARALFLLSQAYTRKPSLQLAQKIELVADAERLDGYRMPGIIRTLLWINQWRELIVAISIGMLLLLLSIMIARRWNKQPVYYMPFVFIMLLASTAALLNLDGFRPVGVLAGRNIMLRDAPSGSASIKATPQEGHQVNIKGRWDVWYKVEWQGKELYTHRNNLLLIQY